MVALRQNEVRWKLPPVADLQSKIRFLLMSYLLRMNGDTIGNGSITSLLRELFQKFPRTLVLAFHRDLGSCIKIIAFLNFEENPLDNLSVRRGVDLLLRGAKSRVPRENNPGFVLAACENRDCFAPLAMTLFGRLQLNGDSTRKSALDLYRKYELSFCRACRSS